jgi:hypothetical protein
MQIRLEVQPDRRRLAAAMRHVARRSLLSLKIVGVLVWLVALVYLALGSRFMAVLHVVLGAFFLWAVPAILVRHWVRVGWQMYGIPTVWEFSDEGVHTRNELLDSTIKWAALNRVEPMPGQLLFKINR